ncbi:Nucleoporin SEH1 [Saguinus oedipus]|uniref:Nucleoporin SEH1 n=1 Tax=Saguinus oedipus TaxID=9490 RepID=A0ABQ9UDB5_SAGOE|nr:Nucleoporin SEH1 [Saguinus oedipus]
MTSRAHSPMIAVGSDDSSPNAMAKVQIFEYNENTRLSMSSERLGLQQCCPVEHAALASGPETIGVETTVKYAKAETLMTVTDPVHDIAFAPNLGRSFHILAIATKDVRIFTLKPVRKELTSSGGPTKFELHIVAQFDNHNSQVWRVSWNITGTVLASSGDDGCVRLWKANYMDNWKCTGILKGNGSPVNGSSQQGNSNPSLEHSCDADTANLQYPHPRRRYLSRPLNPLPENEGTGLTSYSLGGTLYGASAGSTQCLKRFGNHSGSSVPPFQLAIETNPTLSPRDD